MSAVLSQEKVTTLAELKHQQPQLPSVQIGFNDQQGFALMQRVATALASSTLVPTQFQGNLPNCLIGLEMAQRIGASPLMVMQNLYVVHGRPGWSSKFLIASFNQCGRFTAVRYEWSGTKDKDDWGCKAWANEKTTGDRIEGPLITIGLAKKEGWYQKSGSKWQTIPELMLMYRAAAWMINTNAPEISMGLSSAEEAHDVYDAQQTGDNAYSVATVGDLQATEAPASNTEPTPEAGEQLEGAPFTFDECIEAVATATTEEAMNTAADAAGSLDLMMDQQKQLAAAVKEARKRIGA